MPTRCLTCFDNAIKIRDQGNLIDGTADVCNFIASKGEKQWGCFSPFPWSIIPCKNNECPHSLGTYDSSHLSLDAWIIGSIAELVTLTSSTVNGQK